MMDGKLKDELHEFVEVDPTGRYGRYNEILGKGASKIVYKAFDEYEGIEVAWNQVKLNDFLQRPEDMERLYCEIHLLKTLKHKNIMKLYTSWVDISKKNINFVTQLFSSGTLRQYRQKHKRVHIRVVKHWCRQILKGLLYLHSHDPPIIHRDLKCDNIFINGNQGAVKIGDLGLAAVLRKPHAAHCVGTPEFMAPEVYEEEYNELVDIYSFGMCILEMVTFEYPYSECNHSAHIFKKVMSGTKPEALYRVKDTGVKQFVEKCLATASQRVSARELLKDPFLYIDDDSSGSWEWDVNGMCQILSQPSFDLCSNGSFITNGFGDDFLDEIKPDNSYVMNHTQRQPSHNLLPNNGSLIAKGFTDDVPYETMMEKGWEYNASEFEIGGLNLFSSQEDDPFGTVDITINGTKREDGGIFLRLRIANKEGRLRNIYFPFDIETDTALSVANEMVGELDITDYGVTRIAEMIDGEVTSLVPQWKPGTDTEVCGFPTTAFCSNCASNVSSCVSPIEYLSIDSPGCTNLQSAHFSGPDCAAMHGQFEESLGDRSEHSVTEEAPVLSSSQSEILDLSSLVSRESHSDEDAEQLDQSAKTEKELNIDSETKSVTRGCVSQLYSNSMQHESLEASESRFQCPASISNDYENKINKERRWLKSKYQIKLMDKRNQQLGGRRALNSPSGFHHRKSKMENGVAGSSASTSLQVSSEKSKKSFNLRKHFSCHIPPHRNMLHMLL